MQTQPIKSKSGGITSVIAGGDFMDGAAGALIGYLTNHAMHPTKDNYEEIFAKPLHKGTMFLLEITGVADFGDLVYALANQKTGLRGNQINVVQSVKNTFTLDNLKKVGISFALGTTSDYLNDLVKYIKSNGDMGNPNAGNFNSNTNSIFSKMDDRLRKMHRQIINNMHINGETIPNMPKSFWEWLIMRP